MNYSPTPLALLISAIGSGLAPQALASVNLAAHFEERAIATLWSLPDASTDRPEIAMLPCCIEDEAAPGESSGLSVSWQPAPTAELAEPAQPADAAAFTAPARTATVSTQRSAAPPPALRIRILEASAPRPPEAVPTRIDAAMERATTLPLPVPMPSAAAEPPSIEPVAIRAETPVDRVLRQLGAILSDERDEVGAIRSEPRPAVLEDGATRRLRKLAARAARAEATPLDASPPARPLAGWQTAVGEAALDRVRGGFTGDGLSISFGIERAVYVNGTLVTTTSLNISDLGRISAGRATASFDINSLGLIQSGAGNVVGAASVSIGSIGTVIQNTLDGQKIQNVTIINATTNSLGVLKGMNLQSSLRGAVIDSLRR